MAKASAELIARFEELTEVVPDAERKLLFGCPAVSLGGYMFFGAHETGLFVKLGPEDADELLKDGGKAFEPMPGRAMGNFYTLPDGDVADWVRRAHDHVKTLPPKQRA
jgi:hypothetical protein